MSTAPLPNIASFRKQQLYLEFASLKAHGPEGIYLSLTPGDPSLWSGVLFIRTGTWSTGDPLGPRSMQLCAHFTFSDGWGAGIYSPGIFRLQISFPDLYPDIPPLITFSTDIFHPLVVPLTTYTFSTGAVDAIGTVSATDDQRLPSGAFSLRNGFPGWFERPRQAGDSRTGSRRVSGNSEVSYDAATPTSPEGAQNSLPNQDCSVVNALACLKSSFEDPEILDGLPLAAAANPGAWHAWRSYRGLPKVASRDVSPAQDRAGKGSVPQKQPGDWNWEGVFEKRVKTGIEASISDAVLFGSVRPGYQGNETIRFRKLDEEQLESSKEEMLRKPVE